MKLAYNLPVPELLPQQRHLSPQVMDVPLRPGFFLGYNLVTCTVIADRLAKWNVDING
jgi:hypothetical protein